MARKRIVIAGGSGFIGRSLQRHFQALGREVVVLTRDARRPARDATQVPWDGRTLGGWADTLDGAEAIVNLTGRSVDCRYNAANRREILESRVESVRVLGDAVRRCGAPPRVWVQASTTAIYGETGDAILDETARPNEGFSPGVAKEWERAFDDVTSPQTRKVVLRISFVLGRDGGALHKLGRLARLGLGGSVGTGRQWVSWVHHRDLDRIVQWAIDRDEPSGLYHATCPEPVTNARFMRAIRRAVRRPWSPPAPAWAVRLGCVLMRTEAELALKGRRCVPKRLLDAGFRFEFTEIDATVAEALGGSTSVAARAPQTEAAAAP